MNSNCTTLLEPDTNNELKASVITCHISWCPELWHKHGNSSTTCRLISLEVPINKPVSSKYIHIQHCGVGGFICWRCCLCLLDY